MSDCDGTSSLSSILSSSSSLIPTIPCGTCAIADLINGETLSAPNGLDIEGMLYFPPSASGILEVAHIIVQGVLKIDPPTPLDDAQGRTNGQVKILLNGPDSDVYMTPHNHNAAACSMSGGSCNVGKRPIVVAGGRLDIQGVRDIATDGGGSESCPAWVPLRSVVSSSSETLLSIGSTAASCWDSTNGGDLLLTNAAYRGGWSDQKVLSVVSSNTNGLSGLVTVDGDTLGDPPTEENEPTMPAEIASLSRPVVFESVRDGPSDGSFTDLHGGHLIIFHTPNLAQRLEGVEIRNFGQQGKLGRYPIHFHKCGRVGGSVVKNNVIRDSLQRCIVVHRSNRVLVENNVAYNTFGHCFITEDGVETDNIFKENLGAKTKKQRLGIGTSDNRPATFWVTNTRNYFVGNVAAGSQSSGFWFQGAGSMPLYQFERNIAHNNNKFGIALYPNGYIPEKKAYFDDCKMYNNNDGGIKMKRTRNIRIRNNFFADNTVSIEYFSNPKYDSVADSTFYAVAPRHAATSCVNGARGIEFSLDRSHRQIQVTNSTFHGFGNVPKGCAGPGVALKLTDIEGKADDEYGMPLLSEVTFDSPGNSFGIKSRDFVGRTIFLEDEDGGMNPTTSGGPGFYVHNEVHNMAFLDGLCSATSGIGSKELQYCQNVCMRRVYIDTGCCSSTSKSATLEIDAKLVLTSRTDETKTFTYDKRTIVKTNTRGFVKQNNQRFDIALPADEYNFTLVDPKTNERVSSEAIIKFDRAPSCVGYITKDSFQQLL
eukprot:CAMPEP_0194285494 /NCGR_PEP_ID=MMETSP0169-20130528/30305_1 /TAXON_ID=218684 /ORGANISM="Corethron pennatum, Strain L29A3" /LENGTH=763 /DNA_ID=CAMNT_0039031631 /DNA_START=243 /DNA_END=2534 /DNA_ORIENTATION=+